MKPQRTHHTIIKRGGILSKSRACHWCGAQRWTGWWIRPKGFKRFFPSCSARMTEHFRAHDVDAPVTDYLNLGHAQLREHEDEDTVALRRAGDRARAKRAGNV